MDSSLNPNELKMLRELVSLPTAPFCEQAIQSFVFEWAAATGIKVIADRFGNLRIEYPGKGPQKGPPWAFQAHMDHPGFCLINQRGKQVEAWFRGGVKPEYFPQARMQFFPVQGDRVTGTVISAVKDEETGFLQCRIVLDEATELLEGTLGMWDLPPWRRRGDRLNLRVADDLSGVASILLAFERLKRAGSSRRVYGLLTRAEEVGFVGAIAATQSKILDPSWPILGIETSREQPSARLGKGAVVRVGDSLTVFSPDLTAHLRLAARELKSDDATSHLNFSESLMPGGSTESTGLALMGYKTCAVCLPLGNYHNMGADKIAPEQIRISDLESLIALLVHVSQREPNDASSKADKKRIIEKFTRHKSLL